MITDNYTILIQKLDEFIRKYYRNKLLRGAILLSGIFLGTYLITAGIEYYSHLEPKARTFLFYSYVLINSGLLTYLVLLPLFQLYHIGKIISHDQAAEIIGKHFSDIQDRLINTLQLRRLRDYDPTHAELIEASIEQKISHLKPIPFQRAIDLKKNSRYIPYALPPLLIILILLLAAPSFITGPTTRLIHHNVYYEKPVPFKIEILNKSLKAVQQGDFQLDISVSGEEIPLNLFIEYGNAQFRLVKESNILYHYHFNNLQNNVLFQISAEDFRTKEYELTVLPRPIVLNFEIELIYPHYTHKTNDVLENTGDVLVPFGTLIQWRFYTRDTKELILRFKDKVQKLEQKGTNTFTYASSFREGQTYSVTTYNEFLKNQDSLSYAINIIPDLYPSITVEEFKDSIYDKRLYFKGMIKDDYGFTKLRFNYRILKGSDSLNTSNIINYDTIGINSTVTQQQYFHFFDLAKLAMVPGDGLEYYFEVWDNDEVSGNKSSRTQKMFFKSPTLQELSEKREKSSKQMKDEMDEAIKDAQKLKKIVEDLQQKMVDKKELGWQEKKQLQDMLNLQQNLQDKVEKMQKENKNNTLRDEQYRTQEERILDKQKQLEDLFREVMSDDMKKTMEEMQKMMDKLDKNKLSEMLDKVQLNSEDLEKQLDRNLEIYKQLELEKKMGETKEKLDSLQKDQEKLSEESLKKDADNKDLEKKQDDLNKEFEEISEDMKDLQEKNKELEEPKTMENTDEKQQDIKNDMKNSSESLKNKKNKKAAQSQKNAAQKMKEMSQKMDQMMQGMEGKDMEDDLKSMRQILENLIQVSFNQESLMLNIGKTKTYDPQYVKLIKDEKNLKDDLQMIEDSLFALSKRQASLKPLINREISAINQNVDKVLEEMTERRTPTAVEKQQLVMTGVNNLALLLQEAKDQMQQQQMEMKGGGKSGCGKGKKGEGSPSMKKLQEALNKQMEDAKKQMEKGPGKPGPGQPSQSEEFARMAAQQQAIRKQLQELRDEMAKEGKSAGGMNKALQDMEETETDLVNKRITQQTLMRQKEILTRLLESENAQKEREKEERRESTEAKNQNFSNPKDFFEYTKLKSRETELLKTVPPTLNSFYKNKVSLYFYNFEQ
ncbi:MAG: DUF4175 family protein [Bacteroidota bacterium]